MSVEEFKTAISQLAHSLRHASGVSKEGRQEGIEQLYELGRQGLVDEEVRSKKGVLRAVVRSLSETFQTGGGLAEIWSTWGPQVQSFLGI